MSEARVIQLIGAALGAALTILIAPVLPLYVAGLSAAQGWFAATLLGVSVAWSAVEFLPPLLGEEGETVTMPSINLPFQRGHITPEPTPMAVARPAPQVSDSQSARYAAKLKKDIVGAWQIAMKANKDAHHARYSFDRTVIGPMTVSVALRLHWPLESIESRVKKNLRAPLSAKTGIKQGDIGINIDTGLVWLDFPAKNVWTPDGPMLAEMTPAAIPLDQRTERDRRDVMATVALNRGGQPLRIDLAKYPTVGYIGPSGRGKTSALVTALYTICANTRPDRFQFVVMAEKLDTWTPWLQSPYCAGVYCDGESITAAMQHLIDSEFEQRRLDEWGDFPSLVVVADDLADVSLHGKALSDALSKISTSGRSTRMYLWISTQAGGSNRGMADMIIGANMLYRIIFATADPGEAYRAAGVTGYDLSLSSHLGDAYIIVDGRPIRGATGFIDSADIRALGGGVDKPIGLADTLPPTEWGYSTKKRGSDQGSDPHPDPRRSPLRSPVGSPPESVGNRDLTDSECLAVWYAMKDNGGDHGVNEMQRRLWGGDGGKRHKLLKQILAHAEFLLQGNDADIFDQLSDIDTDVLGDDNG